MAYTTVTRAQFRSLLLDQLGSGGLRTTFWRTDELNKVIQSSLRFWNLLTGYWKARTAVTTTVVAGVPTLWYTLPNAITSQMRVSWQSQPLSPASIYDLSYGRPSWRSETTTSGGDVPTTPKVFAIGALNLLAIWPADAAGNSTMTIDGLASTPILNADTDKLDIGQDEFASLLQYCQHVAAFKQGGKEFQGTLPMFKAFLQAAAEKSAILKASATYRKWMGLDRGRWQRKVMIPVEEATIGGR